MPQDTLPPSGPSSQTIQSPRGPAVQAAAPLWLGLAFAGTILLGAFLLFQVQPLISRFILPWFGGAPAVWTTSMLFFQVLLFAGYSYAHLASSRMSLRVQAVAQVVLLLAAAALLPIAPSAAWKPEGSDAPIGHIFLLLLATVGLPYFVLSTTSPLIQHWFSRSYPGRSPYRLYALSNVGSLVALLSYPFVFEPALDLPAQSWWWSGTFVAYALVCGACGAWMWRKSGKREEGDRSMFSDNVASTVDASGPQNGPVPAAAPASVTWLRRAAWVLLPACASMMLLATTNHVCQDVAVVPFLWVVPLSLYLLSFIICFDHPRWYVRGLWAALALLGILAAAAPAEASKWLTDLLQDRGYKDLDLTLDYAQTLVIFFAALFFICMVCHGELVRLRPDPRHLTEYYLLISLGGALGGATVSLASPMLFKTFFEWPLGLIASFAIAAAVLAVGTVRAIIGRVEPSTGPGQQPVVRGRNRPLAAAGSLVLVTAATFAVVAIVAWHKWGTDDDALFQTRNFWGVVSVRERDKGKRDHRFLLRHGAITHGMQLAHPEDRHLALSYYGSESGVGRSIAFFQRRQRPVRVATVGLGVGTMASYARKSDVYRFYEINPAVREIAEDDRFFTYLADARQRGATVDIVMGDARLSMDREPPKQYDVIVLDAFSGDSIPVHLLTSDAFAVYRRHLAPGGVIAVHVSNRHLSLTPVVRQIAAHYGMEMRRICSDEDEENFIFSCDWVPVTENRDFLKMVDDELLEDDSESRPEDDRVVPLWTDHYSNLFQILK